MRRKSQLACLLAGSRNDIFRLTKALVTFVEYGRLKLNEARCGGIVCARKGDPLSLWEGKRVPWTQHPGSMPCVIGLRYQVCSSLGGQGAYPPVKTNRIST